MRTSSMRSKCRIRRGASMLAVAAVVACGLTVGAGTATAEPGSAEYPQLSGSANYLPALPGVGAEFAAGSLGVQLPYCNEGRNSTGLDVDGIRVFRHVPLDAYPGELVTSTTTFFPVDQSEWTERYIERYTVYLPAGSSYVSSQILSGDWVIEENSVPTIDKTTSAVTFTGKWLMGKEIGVQIHVNYTTPLTAKPGSVLKGGFGFTAAGSEPQDWPERDGDRTKVAELCQLDPTPPGGA